MNHPRAAIHRMFELIEPIATTTFSEIANDAFLAVGMTTYWDGYFAGRAAALGDAPAEVVHAVFYNFADGEVARHIPAVWNKVTPREAIAIREKGSTSALRSRLGDLADSPELPRITDVLTRAALSAPTHGRALFAGLRTTAVPQEPVARLWHSANLLREFRGDGHNATLLAHQLSGGEAHAFLAIDMGMKPAAFGRLHHLPAAHLEAIVTGLHERGLIDAEEHFTPAGRDLKDRVEAMTDELAAPAYDVLSADELERLMLDLEPFSVAATD
ncbi:SCO6745 family protein [Calidifontibacter indicus]|uniref:SCO6745 family protein n=1 Tax=Calidifontibacter indicus TaxID=419650 RepID=UPI003D70ADA5